MKKPLHTGKNLCDAQKYENAIWALHPDGKVLKSVAQQKSEKVSKLYAEWSESNPGHSKESGKIEYAKIHNAVWKK